MQCTQDIITKRDIINLVDNDSELDTANSIISPSERASGDRESFEANELERGHFRVVIM